jgi:hypothetical protein
MENKKKMKMVKVKGSHQPMLLWNADKYFNETLKELVKRAQGQYKHKHTA